MRSPKKAGKQKQTQSSSKPSALVIGPMGAKVVPIPQELVSSKIEHTKPISAKDQQRDSLMSYRKSIKDIGICLKDKALEVSEGNLLNAKLGLWEAMAVIERMMKENRNG